MYTKRIYKGFPDLNYCNITPLLLTASMVRTDCSKTLHIVDNQSKLLLRYILNYRNIKQNNFYRMKLSINNQRRIISEWLGNSFCFK